MCKDRERRKEKKRKWKRIKIRMGDIKKEIERRKREQ